MSFRSSVFAVTAMICVGSGALAAPRTFVYDGDIVAQRRWGDSAESLPDVGTRFHGAFTIDSDNYARRLGFPGNFAHAFSFTGCDRITVGVCSDEYVDTDTLFLTFGMHAGSYEFSGPDLDLAHGQTITNYDDGRQTLGDLGRIRIHAAPDNFNPATDIEESWSLALKYSHLNVNNIDLPQFEFDEGLGMLYVQSTTTLYDLGASHRIGYALEGRLFSISLVPEPSQWLLIAAGLAAIALRLGSRPMRWVLGLSFRTR